MGRHARGGSPDAAGGRTRWSQPTSSRPARSRSTRPRRRSGRGWSRWDRGAPGAYTYDWIENLFGLNMHSADRIHRGVAATSRSETSCAAATDRPGMRVEILEPERIAVEPLRGGRLGLDLRARRHANGSTRLISRNRIAMKGAAAGQRLGHARHGAWLARHGAQDAARNQAASRAVAAATLLRRHRPSSPTREAAGEVRRRRPASFGRHRPSATRTKALSPVRVATA